jgi:predicted PurR-regulated permease PerM
MVNAGFGILLGIGLFYQYPKRLSLGDSDFVSRFLPYVGLWISAFFPLALSIAISAAWREPLLTLTLYGIL